jgi:hypothetical protein
MKASCDPFSRNGLRGQGLETWTIKVFDNLELCAGVIPVTSDAGVTLYPHGSD